MNNRLVIQIMVIALLVILAGCSKLQSSQTGKTSPQLGSFTVDKSFEALFPDVQFDSEIALAVTKIDEAWMTNAGMSPKRAKLLLTLKGRNGFTFPAGFGLKMFVQSDDLKTWVGFPRAELITGDDINIPPTSSDGDREFSFSAALGWGAVGAKLGYPHSQDKYYRLLVIGISSEHSQKKGAYVDVIGTNK